MEVEVEVAEFMGFSDKNPSRKRNQRGEAKNATKVAAVLDEGKPCDEDDEGVIKGGCREIRESGVRCDNMRICMPSLHHLSNFGAYEFGAPTVDVYSVKITVKDPDLITGRPVHLRGTVRHYTWHNSSYPYYELLYGVTKDDPPQYINLDSDGSATLWLSGPKKKLPTADSSLALTFAFKLDDRDVFPLPEDADEETFRDGRLLSYIDGGGERFGASTVFFDPAITSRMCYYVERSRTVWGRYLEPVNPEEREDLSGVPVHVVVDYAHLPWAVMAKVEVTILGGEEEEDVERVWGCIQARSCILSKAIVLFDKSQTESVAVDSPSRSIRLTRSLLGVPAQAFLIISARLHTCDGDLIVSDVSFFRASTGGTFYTTFGPVKFQVQWSQVPEF